MTQTRIMDHTCVAHRNQAANASGWQGFDLYALVVVHLREYVCVSQCLLFSRLPKVDRKVVNAQEHRTTKRDCQCPWLPSSEERIEAFITCDCDESGREREDRGRLLGASSIRGGLA